MEGVREGGERERERERERRERERERERERQPDRRTDRQAGREKQTEKHRQTYNYFILKPTEIDRQIDGWTWGVEGSSCERVRSTRPNLLQQNHPHRTLC